MTCFTAECLVKQDYEPILAYYGPYSMCPELSITSLKLLQRKLGAR